MEPIDTGNETVDHDVLVIKRSYLYAILLPLSFLLGLAGGYVLWGRENVAVATDPTAVVEATVQTTPQRFDVSVDDDPYLGPEDAPVVIVEFSDFNCGYCRKWYQETLQPLLEQYPEQIRFVYRDFPILSESSLSAAKAAQCANEQGAFWEFHNALFDRDEPRSLDTYLQFADEFNLNVEDFQECFDSERTLSEIENDARAAASVGVRGTPAFYINGYPLYGAQPFQAFVAVIENELNN